MKSLLALTGLVLFLSAGSVFAQAKPQDAYKNIAAAHSFAVGGVGRGGAISSAEKDLWVLVQAKDEKSLLALTQEKNPVAQMYGLVGLQYLGSSRAKSVADTIAKSSGKVEMISGCIVHSENLSTVARDIAKGTYNSPLKYDMENRK